LIKLGLKNSKLIILAVCLTTPLSVLSQRACAQENCEKENDVIKLAKQMKQIGDKAKTCPNNDRMGALCTAITRGEYNNIKGPEKLGKFLYEQIVYESACVSLEELDGDDTEPVIRKKVQALWDKYGKDLNCASYPDEGNILKTASNEGFDSFIEDAATYWKLDLNFIDPKDKSGGTVIDFLDSQLAGALGPATREKFIYYRKIMVKAGAKKKSELKN